MGKKSLIEQTDKTTMRRLLLLGLDILRERGAECPELGEFKDALLGEALN